MYRVIFPCPRALSPKLVRLNNVLGWKQPHPFYTADIKNYVVLTGQFHQMREKKEKKISVKILKVYLKVQLYNPVIFMSNLVLLRTNSSQN